MSTDSSRDDVPVGTRDDDDDDDALSWGPTSGDRSYLETPVDDVPAELHDAGEDDTEDEEDEELPEGVLTSGMLVVHGVFAMIYILFTIAWLKSIGNVAPSFDSAVASAMWKVGTWLAIAGPAIWYVGTVLLTPTSASRKRVISFIVGAVILLPWPFLILGVA